MEQSEIILLKDSEWSVIDREFCRVTNFVSMSVIKDGKVSAFSKGMPYASINLERKKFPGQKITGFITHRLDFIHLWKAFEERGIGTDEELIIFWSTEHYKNILYKLLSIWMPKLLVMICPKGAFELFNDPLSRPELRGEARFLAMRPIVEWKSEVMK